MINIIRNILLIKGKVFKTFELELYCQKCKTMIFFIMIIKYSNCGKLLDAIKENLRQDTAHAHP